MNKDYRALHTDSEIDEARNNQSNYLTVSQFLQKHPCFTEGGVRAWIFNEHSNGFANCVRRIGRRVYLKPDLVFDWIEAQNQGGEK